MARIPLPTRETLPSEELKGRWDRLSERGPILNIQRAFLANPGIDLNARQIWRASGLTPRARELVILRSAFQRKSQYEWHQHVRIARGEGLTNADINGVRDWQNSKQFSADEQVLLAYVDALASDPRPSDQAFEALARERTPGEVLGVTYLITLYFQLARIMAALDLETEEPFVGWELPAA
jgi:alkylhydroperoxidase family enzyme